ncbi:MAG: hypothetical protein JRI55_18760, partial [Deltaproteobacteria bacterium]|nr:hypothetical protein [Deltaproteobacteria bacterium]
MTSRRETAASVDGHAWRARIRVAPRRRLLLRPRALLLVCLLAASCTRFGFGSPDGGGDDSAPPGDASGDASGDQMTTPFRLELALTSVLPVLQKACRQIDLTIKDQRDQVATLPTTVDVLLSTDATEARLFADSGCQSETSTLSLDSRAAFFFSDDGPVIARAITVTAATQDSQVAPAHLLVQTRARATAVSAGEANTCAVAAGVIQCWGSNTTAELGDGTRTGRLTPTEVTVPGEATSVVTNGYHSCAIAGQGTLYCWG